MDAKGLHGMEGLENGSELNVQERDSFDGEVRLDARSENLDESLLASVAANPVKTRSRTSTRKGLEWRAGLLENNIRCAISAWRKQATYLEQLQSESDDLFSLQRGREKLMSCMDNVTEWFNKYASLTQIESKEDILNKYDSVQNDCLILVKSLSQRIKELTVEKASKSSSRSKKSRASSSRRSKSSTASTTSSNRIREATKVAELKVKLQYLDLVEQKRVELCRLQTLEELSVAEAKLNAIRKEEDPVDRSRVKLPGEQMTTNENVERYFRSSQESETERRSTLHGSEPAQPRKNPPQMNNVDLLTWQHTENHSAIKQEMTSRADGKCNVPSLPGGPVHLGLAPKPLVTDVPMQTTISDTVLRCPKRDSTDMPTYFTHESHERLIKPPKTTFPNVHAKEFSSGFTYASADDTQQGGAFPDNALTGVFNGIAQQVGITRLPVPEPTIFLGDPLNYPIWRSSFDILIGRKAIPPSEKIFYLKKYLGGAAQEAVDGYFLLATDDAFEEAMQLLQQRYGDPFVIANAFRDKLEAWPKVPSRDGNALRRFSDFLRQCKLAMGSISGLRCLDDERENKKMLTKLPEWVILRWARKVKEWRVRNEEFPPFCEFVQFIVDEAEIACDPITSLQSFKVKPAELDGGRPFERFDVKRRNVTGSFATVAEADAKAFRDSLVQNHVCILCSQQHELDTCREFLDKSLSERKEFAVENGLCFGCLVKGHRSKYCLSRKICDICSKKHPTSLHGDLFTSYSSKSKGTFRAKEFSGTSHLNNAGISAKSSMIVPVVISHHDHPQVETVVYALLDTQSDTTFVLESVCEKLGISGPDVKLRLSTMSVSDELILSTKIQGLVVRGLNCTSAIPISTAFTRETIPANRSHIPTPEVANRWAHLRQISSQLSPLMDAPIGLLIGYNCSRALAPREVIPPVADEPFGQRTDLGWGIVGIVDTGVASTCHDSIGVSHHILSTPDVSSAQTSDRPSERTKATFVVRTGVKEVISPADVSRMMELDFSEKSGNETALSVDERKFVSIISDKIRKDQDGHYEMPLPFRDGDPVLPDNKGMAFHRLMSLKRRLISDSRYCQDYTAFMEATIENGVAERIPESELSVQSEHVWYIPHHGVYHPKKPDKIRVVFDCSAKFKGKSLNDHLLQGPDLTNRLQGVLCRFRLEKVAFMCDVKQMFHQFRVSPPHRDYLRFLWWEKGNYNSMPAEYRMRVHLFGAISSPGCANFGLRQVANDSEVELGSQTADFIRQDFYVDDGLKSTPTVEQAAELIARSREMCARGGLTLHKFVSNSPEVMKRLPHEICAQGVEKSDILYEEASIERALGVQWAIESDCFGFRIILKDQPLTRRGLLSTVSSVYDPLGFIAPVILTGKQILQRMCVDKVGWDEPVADDLRPQWEVWRKGLFVLQNTAIARCLKPYDFGKVMSAELHHFSDASVQGYGQCSYLRLVNEQHNVHCSFVMGKSRVTPLKPVTIPRLELTAALVSVRMSEFLKRELTSRSTYLSNVKEIYWTDSQVVLGYINNQARRFHVFVANRVQQIQEHSEPTQWRYVRTAENPADVGSRGIAADELEGSMWLSGPDFLWGTDAEYETSSEEFPVSETDPEVRSVLTTASDCIQGVSDLEGLRYFSKWFNAKRAVANCMWLIDSLLRRVKHGMQIPRCLNTESMRKAEVKIVQMVQREAFQAELAVLVNLEVTETPTRQTVRTRNQHLKTCSGLYRLDPFLDSDGLIRVGGRISRSSFSLELKHPVILPRSHHVTQLLVQHFHDLVQHQGRGITTNEIRSNGFWIIGCSSVVSSVIHKCVSCRKARRPVEQQKMADLPTDRLEEAGPFTFCGVDFFGPWVIKEGRKELKRYGVLFTCLASRAVHLETASSLSADSFINSFRRFVAIRGPVRQIRSDRGTNFVGADNELRAALRELDQEHVRSALLRQRCDYVEFEMNVPSASHMGGVWERQIRTVRSVLSSLLRSCGTHLDDESLRTFMYEAAAVVNSRPLTIDTINDPLSPEPLTPNHLLTMKTKILLPPPGEFQDADVYSRKRWRRVQFLLNEFWHRWKREYIQTLQVRSKWNKEHPNVEIGDVVLVKDESVARNHWPLALVKETSFGADGRVRKVNLIIGDPSLDSRGRRTRPVLQLERPIQKVVVLFKVNEMRKNSDEPRK